MIVALLVGGGASIVAIVLNSYLNLNLPRPVVGIAAGVISAAVVLGVFSLLGKQKESSAYDEGGGGLRLS